MPNNRNDNFIFNWVLINRISIGSPLKNKESVNLLKKKKIKSIISLCDTSSNAKYYDKFIHYNYILPDHRDGICPTFKQILDVLAIVELVLKSGPVFIHCEASKERSPLISISWLVLKESLSLEDAVRYLKQVHTLSNPHFEQLEVLKKLQDQK